MPVYNYRCQVCHRQREIFHSMNYDGPAWYCARCSGPLQRIIANFPHVRFNYKAWYTAEEGTRLLLHASRAGKKSPASEIAGKRT